VADSPWGLDVVPLTVDELTDQAKTALNELKPGVLLEWAALNAKAVGHHARAQAQLKHAEDAWGMFQQRLNLTLYPPTPEQRAAIEAAGPGVADLIVYLERLKDAAAAVKFTEHVMALVERCLNARPPRTAPPPAPQPQNGRRPA